MQKIERLAEQFVPSNYSLSLKIDRPKRTFGGRVVIDGQVVIAGEIRLHAKDLSIKSAKLDGEALDVSFDEHDQLLLRSSKIKAGQAKLAIEFNGKISDSMHGMYPCYFKHEGEEKEIIATQFESHHAREVFPCIDEPVAKATFDVALETETDVTVLGNMPIKDQSESSDKLVTIFYTTPRMSPYLLAWAYGDLHGKSTKTKNGTKVSIWATSAQSADSFDFALETARRAIEFYEDYFDTPYPLPKSDHIALPDFDSLAMENWGLITYREIGLLAPPNKTSLDTRKEIAQVICHELAHQWFGNLVTMEWWDDLWLNESFAKNMEYFSADHLFPDWNMWLGFTGVETNGALRRDSLEGIQPVKVAVNHPDEIGSIFDPAIVYAKGAKLIKMLQAYVGDEDFRDGLKHYFETHSYSNTTGNDLWNAIAKSSGKDVSEFMHSWLDKPGYPMVEINRHNEQLEISQKRFFVGPHKPSDYTWPIPLGATCSKPPKLLSKKSVTVKRTAKNPVLLNKMDEGHFITKYSQDMLNQILNLFNGGRYTPTQRMKLLVDYILLARAGEIKSADLIDIVSAFKNETEHEVWNMSYSAIAELKKFTIDNEPAEQKLKALVGSIAKQNYDRLGWHHAGGESENDKQLQSTAIAMMIYAEDKSAINEALKLYQNSTIENIDPELRLSVLVAAVKYGPKEVFDDLLDKYSSTHLSDLRDEIAISLTSTKSEAQIKSLLAAMLNTKIIKPQDTRLWYAYLIRGRYSQDLTWQWLRDNWSWIEETFGSDKTYDVFIRYSASGLYSKRQLKEFRKFFESKISEPSLKRAIELGISEIEGRVELIERDGEVVRQKLLNL